MFLHGPYVLVARCWYKPRVIKVVVTSYLVQCGIPGHVIMLP
jgi:hypothetical protein